MTIKTLDCLQSIIPPQYYVQTFDDRVALAHYKHGVLTIYCQGQHEVRRKFDL